jgi:hypothetical protein
MREWLIVFAITQVVELAVVGAILGRRGLILAFVGTAITHPIVWFVLPNIGLRYAAYVWTAELFAWLFEAAIYRRILPWPKALLLSFAANAASATAVALLR